MQHRSIGSLNVSVVGLGCNNFGWRLDAAATKDVVDAALNAGINFFDTADIYGKTKSEEFLGQALGTRRNNIILATKFGMPVDEQRKGAKPAYIRRALEDSLTRLRTDRIDLYQIHRPDPETPIADTLGALGELVKAGKIREIGCSNFSAEQLREAAAAVKPGNPRFVSVQNEYSLLHREPEKDVLAACEQLKLAFLPYFPLASGLLTGKLRKGQPTPQGSRLSEERFAKNINDAKLDTVEALIAFAASKKRTILELAFSWLLRQPVVASVIAGATSPEQIHANAEAANWTLSPAELAEVDKILARG
jgi:aryl-alcohol dehydrogenase-like predicted oxidoreductase